MFDQVVRSAFSNFLSILFDGSPFTTIEFPDFQFSKLNHILKPLILAAYSWIMKIQLYQWLRSKTTLTHKKIQRSRKLKLLLGNWAYKYLIHCRKSVRSVFKRKSLKHTHTNNLSSNFDVLKSLKKANGRRTQWSHRKEVTDRRGIFSQEQMTQWIFIIRYRSQFKVEFLISYCSNGFDKMNGMILDRLVMWTNFSY